MFGANLQYYSEAIGLSQSDLALQTGMSVEALQELEADITDPTPEVIEQLARALGVTAEELTMHEDHGTPGGNATNVACEKP
jgi:transcriptional regulator with XRE-family HTH domain